jgi:DMSO/TMAO reductase YedYZ molybdopterin-dependent catalytic subunit
MATTDMGAAFAVRDQARHPGLLTGALVGLLLTAALTGIFSLADAVFGLPFVPFDVLDWMVRILPGGLLTFGIDTMVAIITGLQLGETSSAAKTAEHVIAIVGLLATGAVAATIFFYILNRPASAHKASLRPGLILGVVVGAPVMLISYTTNFTATADPIISAVWIMAAFLAWGAAAKWIYDQLRALAVKSKTGASAEIIDPERRAFLIRIGGASATITVIGAGLGAFLRPEEPQTQAVAAPVDPELQGMRPDELPNAGDPVEAAPGTRPEYTPVADHYRIDISARPPVINGETYVLPITGLVNNPLELTLDDIRADFEPMDQYVTLSCISNPLAGDLISTTKWTGVSLQKLLAAADLQENAAYLRIFGADGFDETVSIDLINEDERIMLAYDWDNAPLPVRNGFPLRIYIPDRYGMKQPKWITEIEVVEAYQEGYWVRRGWDEIARMQTTSVIDTVATDAISRREGQFFVPIGGIAHAGARSISRVEVQIDGGEWQEALLRAPLSDTTWVIWRFDWPFEEGEHTFRVRARDGGDTPQIEESRGARPSGATGVHSRRATL